MNQITLDEQRLTLLLTTTAPTACCPLCATVATHVHSAYTRTVADLPWAGCTVRVLLVVRKFFCQVATCTRRIFTERLPGLVAPYARRTLRLSHILGVVGLALGGEAGTRLVTRLGMAVSPRTLLRHLRRIPVPTSATPRVLGIDDFAFRKGRTYGTILVDLEQHRPIDLLPDRTAATVVTWLLAHPGVEIISRDRSPEYRRAATLGAPQARQVADRFHLVKNLREALERLLERHRSRFRGIELPRTSTAPLDAAALPRAAHWQPARRSAATQAAQQVRRAARQACYQQVHLLHATGESIVGIARQVGLSRGTVYHYLRSDSDPTAVRWQSSRSQLEPYLPYLYQRWQEGCENGTQLWREIREQGYQGCRKPVAVWLAVRRRTPAQTGPCTKRPAAVALVDPGPAKERQKVEHAPASLRLSYFLLREPESLTEMEETTMQQIQEACREVASAYSFVQEFLQMVRQHTAAPLEAWLGKVRTSGLTDLQSFAEGLERDKDAIVAGLSESWSNGPVEGHVNKLKLLKRAMYGRAKFDLLRQRVLAPA